jgi:hypothetical protein
MRLKINKKQNPAKERIKKEVEIRKKRVKLHRD